MLVGLDGSAESERGLTTTLRLFGAHCGLLVLAEVVHYEAAECSLAVAAEKWLRARK